MERAVAFAMDSPFGGVVWTRHDTGGRRADVDTVYLGAYRREALDRVGLFDETLSSSEDEEMNMRLRKAGGRVVLDTSIRTLYIPQDSLGAVFRKYYGYGFWKVPVMLKHRRVFSTRSLAPIAFVASLSVLVPAAVLMRTPRRLLAVELGAYAALAAYFGARSIGRRNEAWRLLPRTLAVFATFHIGYGVGMFYGLLQAARRPTA